MRKRGDRALCGAVGQVLGVVTAVSRSAGHVDDRTTAWSRKCAIAYRREVDWGDEVQRKVCAHPSVQPVSSSMGEAIQAPALLTSTSM